MHKLLCLVAILACVIVAMACLSHSSAPSSDAGLRTIRDTVLPGDTSRFDYESFDPESGRLYIAHLGEGSIIVFDTRKNTVVATINDVAGVHGVLAVPALGRVYASATDDDEVAVIDMSSSSVVARVPAGDYPDGIAYDPDTAKLYVSDEHGGTDSVIDTKTNQRIATIKVGGEAGNTQYDSASHRVYVAVQTSNELIAIDPQTDHVVERHTLPGCRGAHGLLIDSELQAAFVGCEDNATLAVFDLRRNRVTETHSVGTTPDVLAADPNAHLLYVAAEDGVLTTFGEENLQLRRIAKGFVGPNAHAIVADQSSHDVYLPLKDVDGHPVLREMALGVQRAE